MKIVALDHVQVAAPPGAEPEARRFYGELLGLAEVEKPAALRDRGGVWFELGEQQLHVGVDGGFAPARKAHPPCGSPRESSTRSRSGCTRRGRKRAGCEPGRRQRPGRGC